MTGCFLRPDREVSWPRWLRRQTSAPDLSIKVAECIYLRAVRYQDNFWPQLYVWVEIGLQEQISRTGLHTRLEPSGQGKEAGRVFASKRFWKHTRWKLEDDMGRAGSSWECSQRPVRAFSGASWFDGHTEGARTQASHMAEMLALLVAVVAECFSGCRWVNWGLLNR